MHNVSWGVTNTGADVQDIYLINTTADGAQFWDDRAPATPTMTKVKRAVKEGAEKGYLSNFVQRTERIEVKHGEAVDIIVRTVPGVGPVISDNGLLDAGGAIAPPGGLSGTNVLAMRWVSIDPTIQDTTMVRYTSPLLSLSLYIYISLSLSIYLARSLARSQTYPLFSGKCVWDDPSITPVDNKMLCTLKCFIIVFSKIRRDADACTLHLLALDNGWVGETKGCIFEHQQCF